MLRVSVVVASLKARTWAAVAASAAPKPIAPSVVAAAPAPASLRKPRRERSSFIEPSSGSVPGGRWVRGGDGRRGRGGSQGRRHPARDAALHQGRPAGSGATVPPIAPL